MRCFECGAGFSAITRRIRRWRNGSRPPLSAGIPASRVFFAPTHLRAGGSWSAQLAQEIAEATAFILLVGEAGIGNWQVPEYDEALDKWVKLGQKFPLIVVLLEGQTAPGLAISAAVALDHHARSGVREGHRADI